MINNKIILAFLVLIYILIIYFKKKSLENFDYVNNIISIGKNENCPGGTVEKPVTGSNKYKFCLYNSNDNSDRVGVVNITTNEDCNSDKSYINEPIKSISKYVGCFHNSKTNPNNIDMTSDEYLENIQENSINSVFKNKSDCSSDSGTNNYYVMGAKLPDVLASNDVDMSNYTDNTPLNNRKAFCKPVSEIPKLRRVSDRKCNTIINIQDNSQRDENTVIKDYLGGIKEGEEYISVFQKQNNPHSYVYANDTQDDITLDFSFQDFLDLKDKCIFYSPLIENSEYYATQDSNNNYEWSKTGQKNNYVLKDYSGNNNHIFINKNINSRINVRDNLDNFEGITQVGSKYGLKFSNRNYGVIQNPNITNLFNFDDTTSNVMITFQVYIHSVNESTPTNALYGHDYFHGAEGRNRGVPLISISQEYKNDESNLSNNDSDNANDGKDSSYNKQSNYKWAFLGNTPLEDNFYNKMDGRIGSNQTKENKLKIFQAHTGKGTIKSINSKRTIGFYNHAQGNDTYNSDEKPFLCSNHLMYGNRHSHYKCYRGEYNISYGIPGPKPFNTQPGHTHFIPFFQGVDDNNSVEKNLNNYSDNKALFIKPRKIKSEVNYKEKFIKKNSLHDNKTRNTIRDKVGNDYEIVEHGGRGEPYYGEKKNNKSGSVYLFQHYFNTSPNERRELKVDREYNYSTEELKLSNGKSILQEMSVIIIDEGIKVTFKTGGDFKRTYYGPLIRQLNDDIFGTDRNGQPIKMGDGDFGKRNDIRAKAEVIYPFERYKGVQQTKKKNMQ